MASFGTESAPNPLLVTFVRLQRVGLGRGWGSGVREGGLGGQLREAPLRGDATVRGR
jgi:hypothetical protein